MNRLFSSGNRFRKALFEEDVTRPTPTTDLYNNTQVSELSNTWNRLRRTPSRYSGTTPRRWDHGQWGLRPRCHGSARHATRMPMTTAQFRVAAALPHAHVARVPTSTFYAWKRGTTALSTTQLEAIATAARMQVVLLTMPELAALRRMRGDRPIPYVDG